jgi:hypothetical protein
VNGAIGFLKSLMVLLFALVSVLFVGLVLIAEINCPVGFCRGPDGDVWMPSIVLGMFYLPVLATVILLVLVVKVARKYPK